MSARLTDAAALPVFEVPSLSDLETTRDRPEDEVVALFDEFRDPLLRYVSSFGLPFPDGEEVVQEVFLALFQHLARGKSRDNLRGWLFRVAHNLGLKRRYRTGSDAQAHAENDGGNLAIDPDPNPEDRLLIDQRQQVLQAVVRALPEQDRRCLFLRAEGLRYREIAAIIGISLGAVSLSLSRSLARISRAAER